MKKISVIILKISLCVSFLFLNFFPCAEHDPLNLSLQKTVDLALESNPDITVERLEPEISKLEIKRHEGAFDPNLSLGIKRLDNETPLSKRYSIAAGGLASIETEDSAATGQLDGKIPTGTLYKFDLSATRSSSTFNQFDPEYLQFLSGTLTQPLLKDFGFGANLAFVRISKNRLQSSKLHLRQTITDTIAQAETAYWDLVFARQDLEVKKESLKSAQSLLEQNQIREKVGALSPLEVIQAQAGVAVRQEALLLAEQKIREEKNRLKQLIFQDMNVHRLTEIIPTELPHPSLQEIPVSRRIELALKHRLDLDEMKIELANQNILLKYYQNQSLPRVDLEGTLGWNGLGGSFSGSWDDAASTDHPLWGAGITFKYPLGARTERARYEMSKLEIKKRLYQLKQLEDQIILQVDTAASQLETYWKRIETSLLSERFAEEALRAEQKKFDAGTSTSHNILEFEEDLAIAKSNRLKVEIEYLKAQIELERLQGTTLQSKSIGIVEEN